MPLMEIARPDPSSLTQTLAAVLDLSQRARAARSLAELGFLLVNDSLSIASYRQSALWSASSGVECLSGLVKPETNAPYAQWLQRLSQHLASGTTAATAPASTALTASDIPEALAREWAEWWPAHALWVPMQEARSAAAAPAGQTARSDNGTTPAAWLLARDEPWSPAEIALLTQWAQAWWHARTALARSAAVRWRAPWRRDVAGALPSRPWWRSPALWVAAAMLAAGAIPVPLSVLAPGELVPANPVVVRAPLEGVVDVFHVQPNQAVRKGDPLFGFDEALIQSRLEVAQQAQATAGTEYRQTMQQALTDARVRPQLAALAGRIQEKRAEVTFLKEQLTRSRVLAPQDGIVLFDDPTEWIGKPVAVGERVLRIATPGDAEVEVWLPMADAIALPESAPVRLYLNASPTAPLTARIRYLGHEAQARPDGSFAYRIRARLDEPTAQRVGLKGTAKLEGETVPAAYWVLRRPLAWLRATLGL